MNAKLKQNHELFSADPDNAKAFNTLVEHYYFDAGSDDWSVLVSLYHHRLTAPSLAENPTKRVAVLVQLAQLLEERCFDVDQAIQFYTEAARLDPTCRAALSRLRKIYATRSQWDMVLQIADVESQAPMEPAERSTFDAELGDIWSEHVGDLEHAITCYEAALERDSANKRALSGLAKTLQKLGRSEPAIAALEKLIDAVDGVPRAAALVQLGQLLTSTTDGGERTIECYRRALTSDPHNADALAGLVESAKAQGKTELLADLYERQFEIASGAKARTSIAIEAGQHQLGHCRDTPMAKMWFERALELEAEDPELFRGLIEVSRELEDDNLLRTALAGWIDHADETPPSGMLLEAASLQADTHNDLRALKYLNLARANSPEDPLVLEALSDTLLDLQRSSELADVLEKRVELSADDTELRCELLVNLARVYEEGLDDLDSAALAYRRAFDTQPDTAGVADRLERLYHKSENWSELRSLLERASLEGPPAKRSAFATTLGMVLWTQFADTAAATLSLEAALDIEPGRPQALEALQQIARESGDEVAARRAFEREAISTEDPVRRSTLVREIAAQYEVEQNFAESLNWIERQLEAEPGDLELLGRAADLCEKLGNEVALVEKLERIDALQLDEARLPNLHRMAKIRIGQERFDDAIQCWESCIELQPRDLAALQSLGHVYRNTRRPGPLADTLERLADVLEGPESIQCRNALAQLLVDELGDTSRALSVLATLVALPDEARPQDADARFEQLLEDAGRAQQLAEQLERRAARLAPEDPEVDRLALRRAQILLEQLDRPEDAIEELLQLHSRRPEFAEASDALELAARSTGNFTLLASLLEERATRCDDPSRRAQLVLERANVLDDQLENRSIARQLYDGLIEENANPDVVAEATRRLERILTLSEDWQALRGHLEKQLAEIADTSRPTAHLRLAELCRNELRDLHGCSNHLEAYLRHDNSSGEIWRTLSEVYTELDDSQKLARALEGELANQPEPDRELVIRARLAKFATEDDASGSAALHHYERMFELDPSDWDATHYLLQSYENAGRHSDMLRVLQQRLGRTSHEDHGKSDERGALLLQIARLQQGPLGEPRDAVDTLSIAHAELGSNAAVTEPLANLLDQIGDTDALIDICREMSSATGSPEEQTSWRLRLAKSLEQRGAGGDLQAAADAYSQVVARCPDDRDSERSLLKLYRVLDQPGPLAEGLRIQLDQTRGAEANVIRFELAQLLADRLDRSDEALLEFMAVLDRESDHREARNRAVSLARELRRHDDLAELLRSQLRIETDACQRAELLEAYGDLLAEELDQPEAAVDAYREAVLLAPDRFPVRRRLRELLERGQHWKEALDGLFAEASRCESEERIALFERGAELAAAKFEADSALPWLMRLRSEKPGDPELIGRIAELHRQAGRTVALLRSLEEELGLHSNVDRRCELHVEMADLLASELGSPIRAISALEEAHRLQPSDEEILRKLEGLYRSTDRHRDLANVLEARLGLLGSNAQPQRAELHRSVARIASERLHDSARAVEHWYGALSLTPEDDASRTEDLQALASALGDASNPEGQARAWEAELALLMTAASPNVEREIDLRKKLAEYDAQRLSSSAAAAGHLRRLLDIAGYNGANDAAIDVETVECALLDQLRLSGNVLELERRLTHYVGRESAGIDSWLELARLRDEKLHSASAASEAYREVLERDPQHIQAIRGLRQLAERLRNWSELARTLDLELAARPGAPEKFALLKRLGELQLNRLSDLDAARSAYVNALDERPDDIASLRALQEIAETQEDARAAIDYYERELALSEHAEALLKQKVWVRIGELASDLDDETTRAIEAYEQADGLAEELLDGSVFTSAHRRSWAELYRGAGNRDRHAEVMTQWCDDPAAGASCTDHVALAELLEQMGETATAAERAQRATEIDSTQTLAWDLLSRLCDTLDRPRDAAQALAQGAEIVGGAEAASRLCRAAALIEEEDVEKSLELLRRAVECDSGSPRPHAALAGAAERNENLEESESAASRALELAEDSSLADDTLRLECALTGGRVARRAERLESAARFFSQALAIEPDHREALENQGEVLYQRGDLTSAQHVLEQRLELPGDNPNLAHHLVIVGTGLELADRTDEAMQKFEQALEAESDCEGGHAGITRLHEAAGRTDDAVLALEAWVETLGDSPERASQLIHAAELESGRENWSEAEGHLRAALAADPEREETYVRLVGLLEDQERPEDAIEIARNAEPHVEQPENRAQLALVAGRALESQSQLAEAAEAFGRARQANPRLCEAALCEARLLRSLGDWRAAAEGLEEFVDAYPDADGRDLAQIYYERGRLMAGPLEDTNEAIRCYEAAVAIEPSFSQAREPLANLLSHLPDKWSRAVEHHRMLLSESPTATSSLRALVRIAAERSQGAHRSGLAILRSLGIASPDELADAPAELEYAFGELAELENSEFERLRQVAQLTSTELADALHPRDDMELPESASEAQVAFWQTAVEAAGELSAPHLCEMDAEGIGEVFAAICGLALDNSQVPRTPIAHTLSQSLGRWTRRKLRKMLEDFDFEALETGEFAEWQSELKTWSNCVALDRCDGDLRTALTALLAGEVSEDYADFGDSSDLTDAVGQSDAAVRLMRCVIDTWCADLSGVNR